MTIRRARRNGVASYMALMPLVLIDAMPEAQETARLSGAAGMAAASGWLRHGMEARRAETAWLALCGAWQPARHVKKTGQARQKCKYFNNVEI
ncbi:hypothetical protein IV511_18855 [Enterobacter quasihormaechei]|uniref:hypothetical protein n=1 Tax=Enterobacter quasihormaechei TaxID=2529382 RepID=UPI002F407AA7